MQELRFVLIIVGALAIAALLFHGLWTSKKEGKSKFGDKPLGRIDVEPEADDVVASRAFAPEDDYEIIRKDRKQPDFGLDESSEVDPLISGYETVDTDEPTVKTPEPEIDDVPAFSASKEEVSEAGIVDEMKIDEPAATVAEQPAEEEMQVIVLNVHCAGNEPFVGTKLFDSLQQNGLLYGEMDIFHRHADLSGTGKVLFSVANMMHPGTLKHDDPAEFTTKGISFFMTLPCFGEPDQNFKLMLKTAQQVADDLGANVLDDARNLMTPDRLAAYRKQITDFRARTAQA
ncbi:cell division protein ZipA [Vibrio fluvialis]|uniref:cell division protein ZipA n=1 Tax=Vibrio fluvialis TaxID=676 RepID=UPI00192BED34|nr:cell division protein ZipA [Vibrio fluvialis]MBL4238909.1 cell division protein ZipA [Vibrio fluvialis]MBL4266174.1 cell division protein ZipA [Vibrio fluvialis]MBL4270890.1 cell division protein ZipA [Vibrio fluvialis]MBL4275049.1 cell division protein ZipA [Vibrio fluvialis]MBO1442337.1 cell division protein ZipA [Vibrio fluvialis]